MSINVSNVYLNILLAHLRRQNTDQAELFSALGISQYGDVIPQRSGVIPLKEFLALLHKVENHFSNTLFSAEAGSFAHPSDFGKLGWVAAACANYEQAVEMAYRYQSRVDNLLRNEPLKKGEHIISRVMDEAFDAEYIRPYVELSFAAMVSISHFITGYMFSDVPMVIQFKHNAQASRAHYMEIFKAPVEFCSACNQIDMHHSIMQAPIYGGDEKILKVLVGKMFVEEELEEGAAFVGQLAEHLRCNTVHGSWRLEDCAREFNMSSSTLKRRMQSHGTSFQQVRDSVRYEIAKDLLESREVNFSDIGYMLGFGKMSAFGRAFKRWSGMSPRQYQRLLV